MQWVCIIDNNFDYIYYCIFDKLTKIVIRLKTTFYLLSLYHEKSVDLEI